MSDQEDFPVFELTEDELPMRITVIDKDGNVVDRILVKDAGVLEIPGYPPEGRPYRVKIETRQEKNTVRDAYLRRGWVDTDWMIK